MVKCYRCQGEVRNPEENVMYETGEYYCDSCWEYFQNRKSYPSPILQKGS